MFPYVNIHIDRLLLRVLIVKLGCRRVAAPEWRVSISGCQSRASECNLLAFVGQIWPATNYIMILEHYQYLIDYEQSVTTLQAVCTQPVALSSAGCHARRRSRHGPRSAAGRTPKPRRTGVPELPFALFRLCKTGGCDRCTALRKQLFLILEQWTVIKDSSRR